MDRSEQFEEGVLNLDAEKLFVTGDDGKETGGVPIYAVRKAEIKKSGLRGPKSRLKITYDTNRNNGEFTSPVRQLAIVNNDHTSKRNQTEKTNEQVYNRRLVYKVPPGALEIRCKEFHMTIEDKDHLDSLRVWAGMIRRRAHAARINAGRMPHFVLDTTPYDCMMIIDDEKYPTCTTPHTTQKPQTANAFLRGYHTVTLLREGYYPLKNIKLGLYDDEYKKIKLKPTYAVGATTVPEYEEIVEIMRNSKTKYTIGATTDTAEGDDASSNSTDQKEDDDEKNIPQLKKNETTASEIPSLQPQPAQAQATVEKQLLGIVAQSTDSALGLDESGFVMYSADRRRIIQEIPFARVHDTRFTGNLFKKGQIQVTYHTDAFGRLSVSFGAGNMANMDRKKGRKITDRIGMVYGGGNDTNTNKKKKKPAKKRLIYAGGKYALVMDNLGNNDGSAPNNNNNQKTAADNSNNPLTTEKHGPEWFVLEQADIDNNFERFNPFEFEHVVANLFAARGFTIEGDVGVGSDKGADVIAVSGGQRLMIQVKKYHGKVDGPHVTKTIGAMMIFKCDEAIVLATAGFTAQCYELAEDTDGRVELWDRERTLAEFAKTYKFKYDEKAIKARLAQKDKNGAKK